jgi:hypothetical protein
VTEEFERSPRIFAISWGHMDVENLGAGKAFKLYPGGGRPWNWSETGTRHSPGIQPEDVEELQPSGWLATDAEPPRIELIDGGRAFRPT